MNAHPYEAPETQSQHLFDRARAVTPGGVNSPVRAFGAVGGTPRFMASGDGALPHRRRRQPLRRPGLLLGPADPGPRTTRRWWRPRPRRCAAGTSYGAPSAGEVELAEEIVRAYRAGRAGAPGLLRDRGHDVARSGWPAASPAAAQGREVRRLLPRPRRRAAGRGRLRRGHLRAARHPRRDRRRRPATRSCCPTTTVEAVEAAFADARRRDRLPDHRGRAGQHGHRPAGAGLQRSSWPTPAGRTARCSSPTR